MGRGWRRECVQKDGLELEHDVGSLNGVRAGTDLEVEVGCRDAELLKENIGHGAVVMLTGMHQAAVEAGFLISAAGIVSPGGFNQGRDLHEVRSGTSNEQEFQGVKH